MEAATSTGTIDKVLRVGTIETNGGAHVSIFCHVEYDGTRLSITGVIGPRWSGNAYGGAGQIDMEFQHRNPSDDDSRYSQPIGADEISYADGWDADRWLDFLDIWKRWHMNDLRAECEHQRELGWTYATHAGQDCPVCGYRIGSQWLREDVPGDVVDFLASLPVSDREPAWV